MIERTQRRFWRLGAWLDDSGTESTGRYQSGMMLALDNPTSLSDLFYLTASRDLGICWQKKQQKPVGTLLGACGLLAVWTYRQRLRLPSDSRRLQP
ncbi:Uncharacterised protein [Pantoea agglomerans]|uniref:Haemolysin activator HlyB C-terminal domain-containing protein n=1 Tax=Enterobacter agglomerans TaxID=549 RepID=A0A379AIH9_ENTAG|nr:Uncharacterised protein [Pantoea agglomerans]